MSKPLVDNGLKLSIISVRPIGDDNEVQTRSRASDGGYGRGR